LVKSSGRKGFLDRAHARWRCAGMLPGEWPLEPHVLKFYTWLDECQQTWAEKTQLFFVGRAKGWGDGREWMREFWVGTSVWDQDFRGEESSSKPLQGLFHYSHRDSTGFYLCPT